MNAKIFTLIMLLAVFSGVAQEDTQKLIDQLSVDEKIYLSIGTGMDIPGIPAGAEAPQAVVGSTKSEVAGAAGTSYPISKINLPPIVFADGPAGIRIDTVRPQAPGKTFYATAFPTASSLSSSWNIELAQQIGQVFGIEGRDYGVDFLLAPALNIHRNPLGGRNFEYYSEDPILAGEITAGFVNGVQAEGLGATIKHFVANNSETNRTALNTVVSERALREIYLRGFKLAIDKSEPWAIMSSYNKINGTYASENSELLTDLLRKEWGYEGFVMTDWFAGLDAVAQMRAGNDLLMPGTEVQFNTIKEAITNGTLEESILDRNLTATLNGYKKTFSYKCYEPSGVTDLEGHKMVSRNAALEGMVLLKNENKVLPLKSDAKIALYGSASYETIAGGTGSGDVNKAYSVSVFEGLKNANVRLDQELTSIYEVYMKEERAKIPPKAMFFLKDELVPEKTWTEAELTRAAKANDVAVFTLGRTSGEFQDRIEAGDFELTAIELELISDLKKAFAAEGKPLVVLLNVGGVTETNSWKTLADAILLTWQPGQEAGNAITDLLLGKANPSGKLPVTFPIALDDNPSSKNFPGIPLDPNAEKPANPLQGIPSEEIYEEGIYVGYRYFDTFEVPVSYPFGYGMSYTTFEYSDLQVESGATISVSFTVKNTGSVAGKEIAQLYVSAPDGTLEKPSKELKAFAKTALLEPGASEIITLEINPESLASYDDKKHAWILDGGTYALSIAENIASSKLKATLEIEATTVRETEALLGPQNALNTLSKN